MARSKLKEHQVLDILNSSKLHRELAEQYKVNAALIGRIKQKKIWRHITDPINFNAEMKHLKEASA